MIQTSNYYTAWGKPNAVRISNGMPNGFVVSDSIPELYPKWSWVKAKLPWEEFQPLYQAQLEKLDVHTMAKRCEGKILLCFETLSKAHCHREQVRDWFIANGYECEELPPRIAAPKPEKVLTIKEKAKANAVQETIFGR
jgi:hypothetical protein